jgi:small subunit ribosomal protein S13
MARISGVDLPRDKRIEIGLTYIYGIGRTSSGKILEQANVNPDPREGPDRRRSHPHPRHR